MAKNKHEKLANAMKEMLDGIDQHSEKVAQCLNLVQLHFYEKKFILGRPLMTREIFKEMTKSHYIGLQHFSPSPTLKHICKITPALSAIIGQGLAFPGQILTRQTVGWIVPWGVYIILPEHNEEKLKENRLQTLLYAPVASEISMEIDWFEKESASNSFTHQLLTIGAYFDENELLKNNLQQDTNPLYAQAVKEWIDHSLTDEVAKKPKNLDKVDFAPQLGQTLEAAYSAVIRSASEGKSKHRQNLRFRYQVKLEIHMFKDLPWTPKEKMAFLDAWKAKLLKLNAVSLPRKHDRWEQDAGIDCFTAANFIKHFVLKFIDDPMDHQSGEIACILWILIWCAQNGCSDVTVEQIRKLTTKQLTDANRIIQFRNSKIEISQGLHQFLLCLRGKGTGQRSHYLFKHVDKKNLERALHIASNAILPEGVIPALPAAFLVSPHLHHGARVYASERQVTKNIRQLVPYRHTRAEILPHLKNAMTED